MSQTYDFLKDCGFYYLLTIDGDYPSGRPISQILEKDGRLYFGTRAGKAMHKQLTENNHVALIGFKIIITRRLNTRRLSPDSLQAQGSVGISMSEFMKSD